MGGNNFWSISIDQCTDDIEHVLALLPGTFGEAMGGPQICHAFTMMEKSFGIPTILFYLASDANKNKRGDDLNYQTILLCTIPYLK